MVQRQNYRYQNKSTGIANRINAVPHSQTSPEDIPTKKMLKLRRAGKKYTVMYHAYIPRPFDELSKLPEHESDEEENAESLLTKERFNDYILVLPDKYKDVYFKDGILKEVSDIWPAYIRHPDACMHLVCKRDRLHSHPAHSSCPK